MARNRSLELATQPWWLYFDSDDTIEGGERLAEEIRALDATLRALRIAHPETELIAEYPYWYGLDGFGRPTLIVPTRRILSNPKAWHWMDPCHEVLELRGGGSPSVVKREAILWKHHRQGHSGDRNLRILEKHVRENPNPRSRVLFYLGNEYADVADYRAQDDATRRGAIASALSTYGRYLKDVHCPQDERYMAALRSSKLCRSLARYDEALHWASMAMCFNETLSAAYLQMAEVFFARGAETNYLRDQERCLYVCDLALQAKGQTHMWTDPRDAFRTHFLRSFALMKLGRMREAVLAGEEAMKLRPEESDPHKYNVAINTRLAEANILKEDGAEFVRRFMGLKGLYHPVIDGALREVPLLSFEALKSIGHPTYAEWERESNRRTVDAVERKRIPYVAPKLTKLEPKSLRILFLCGSGSWEKWSPESVKKTGIGGSETAVIEMARRLAKRGHEVEVWSETCEPGMYDGVDYRLYAHVSHVTTADVIIAWRDARFLKDARITDAHARFVLWVHDVWALNEEFVDRADTILALSQWHADYLASRNYLKEKIVVTNNGIDLTRFETPDGQFLRNPKRVIYSSSPDRGLLSLLEMWPQIRVQEPQAELHVFYGFANWDKSEQVNVDRDRIKALLFDLALQGVTFHGRVDQKTLAEAMLRSGVWAYPCWFSETYCITLDEVLAAGLYAVTTPVAALKERGEGLVIFVGEGWDWRTPEFQKAFVEAVVRAIREEGQPTTRENLMKFARETFDWERVVSQWEDLFGVLRTNGGATGVPGDYRGYVLRDFVAREPDLLFESKPIGSNGPLAPEDDPAELAERAWMDWISNPVSPIAKEVVFGGTKRRRIHFLLTRYGCDEPPIDPRNPFATVGGGGSRVGFMGLTRAFAAMHPDWDVFAWSYFSAELTKDGVDHRQFEGFPASRSVRWLPCDGVVKPGDVVFAFYDTRPLASVPKECLRIASHHTYRPWEMGMSGDIHLAPSDHCVRALSAQWPSGHWRTLPNGVGDRPVVRRPVKGRILYHTSCDRGLHHLLEAFPMIREAVPEATLHVVGAVDDWTRWAVQEMRPEHAEAHRRAVIIRRFWDNRPEGLSFVGRLTFDQLMNEFAEASVFAYPCDPIAPCESFSISTMECLKMGVPVLLHEADALGEVYGPALALAYGKLGDGYWAVNDERALLLGHTSWQAIFEEQLVCLVRDSRGIAVSDEIQKWASSFTFEAEAKRLLEIIDEYEKKPVIDDQAMATFAKGAFDAAKQAYTNVILSGPMGAFSIPGTPEKTRDICERLSRQVWDGEYDHPDLPSSGIRKVIDLGCGWGAFAVWAKAKWEDAEILGVDPHARALHYAKLNAPFLHIVEGAVTSQENPKIHLEDDWGYIRFGGGETAVRGVHPRTLPPCDILKVDTEGCDVEVLSNYQHFGAVKAILYEWHFPAHRHALADICRRAGFRQVKDQPATAWNADFGLAVWVRA